MEKKVLKKRQVNFEMLRIISMLMIIVHHFLLYGGILGNITYNNWKYYLIYIIEYCCLIAVNIYVMITGYFSINSEIKIKKVLQIELQMVFYSVIFYIISVVFQKVEFNMAVCIKSFFPFITKKYWFLTAYMSLYLIIPFLNKFVKSLSKKEYKRLLFLLLLLISVVPTVFPVNDIFDKAGGYSLIWFMVLYLLAGYVRLFWDNKIISKYKLFFIYIFIILARIIFRVVCIKVQGVNLLKHYLGFSGNYNNILLVIETIVVFLFFRQVKINNKYVKKIVLNISPLMLGVYFIHEHFIFKRIIWQDFLHPSVYLASWKIFIILILDVALVFVCSCCIEKIRTVLFKMLQVDVLVDKLFLLLKNIKYNKKIKEKF